MKLILILMFLSVVDTNVRFTSVADTNNKMLRLSSEFET